MPLDGRTQDFVPAETEVDEVGKVLLRAAEIVRERWQQGGLGFRGGRVCAMGAIHEASGASHDEWGGSYNRLAKKADGRLSDFIGRWIALWNDAKGRTAEEVAQAMEAAARMKE